MIITAEYVRELLAYDPGTGILTWRVDRGSRVCQGKVAGSLRPDGYINIQIDRRNYKAHRLAWLHFYGEWPPLNPDHKDTVRTNNRIENLRPATQGQNCGNRKLRKDSASGLKGAFPAPSGRWRAAIKYQGKNCQLGYFDTPEEAHAAYVAAAEKLFGEFARAA